jgi:hypothetical protein
LDKFSAETKQPDKFFVRVTMDGEQAPNVKWKKLLRRTASVNAIAVKSILETRGPSLSPK